MAWTADYDATSGVTTVTYRGATTGGDFRAGTSAAIAMSKTHGTWRFLIDVSEASISVSSLALFNLPAQFLQEHLDPRSRMAVLLPATAPERELVAFFETVCLNRDWLAHVFDGRDEARRWLLEEATG
jgi:hypothetical protein